MDWNLPYMEARQHENSICLVMHGAKAYKKRDADDAIEIDSNDHQYHISARAAQKNEKPIELRLHMR